MSQEIIKQALALAHQGQLSQARAQLMDMLRQDPDNLSGWGNLYRLCYNVKERRVCLDNILRLRPQDEWAMRKMAELEPAVSGQGAGLDTQPGRPVPPPVDTITEEETPTAVSRQREAATTAPVDEDDVPTAVTRQRDDALKARAGEEGSDPEAEVSTAVTRKQAEATAEASDPEAEVSTAVTRRAEAERDLDPDLDTQEVPTATPGQREEAPGGRLDGAQLPDLVSSGVLTVKAAAFLKAAVLARISILVSAEEASDARALLGTLARIIPPDAPERMVQPDLAVDNVMMFAAAMLAGGGALGSLQAPSVTISISRLEGLMAQAHQDDVLRHREIIVGGLEVLIHVQRLEHDQPAVTAIYEVIGLRDDEVRTEPVFVYGMGSGLLPTGHRPAVMNTIEQVGLALPREVFLAS